MRDQFIMSGNRLGISYALAEYKESTYDATFSPFFPLNTYHYRWKELSKDDLYLYEDDYKTKGQIIVTTIYKNNIYKRTVLNEDDTDEIEAISVNNKEYIYKIKQLCDNNGSRLILVLPPTSTWTFGKERALVELSDELDVSYLNSFLPQGELIDYKTDMYDDNHLNSRGAEKFTEYISNYLINECGVNEGNSAEDYDAAVKCFDKYKEFYEIKLETDCEAYLEKIMSDDQKYAFALCIQKDQYEWLSDEIKDKLCKIGVDGKFENGEVYFAFYDRGELLHSKYLTYGTEYEYESDRYGVINVLNESNMPGKYSNNDLSLANYEGMSILLFDGESSLKFDYVNYHLIDEEMKFSRMKFDGRTKRDEIMDFRRWVLKNY